MESADGKTGVGSPDVRAGSGGGSRLGRFKALDERPINLDGFAERDDEAGLVASTSA